MFVKSWMKSFVDGFTEFRWFMKRICICVTLALLFCACQDEKAAVQKTSAETAIESNPGVDKVNFMTKVRRRIGDAFLLKGGVGNDWSEVKIGNRVVENDRLQTKLESEVLLAIRDGSVLKIDENSDVALKFSDDMNGHKAFLVDVNEGTIYFDIQKQRKNGFLFKTGTAAVAIRGTAGFVGNVKGKTVASLKEGMVDVTNSSGRTIPIVKNQTILVDETGKTQKIDLASSGTEYLARAIDSIAKVSPEVIAVENLEQSLKSFDNTYVNHQDEFKKTLSFRFTESIPDTITENSITLQAKGTPGIIVTVWGERDSVGADSIYSRTLSWGKDAYGVKRFLMGCSDGLVDIPCTDTVMTTVYVSNDSDGSEEENEELAEDLGPATPIETANVDLGDSLERIHLDLPATKLDTALMINLDGVSRGQLKNIESVMIYRGKKVFRTLTGQDLKELPLRVPVSINRNKIADFRVEINTKDGKTFTGKKTFEVFCLPANHPGGKARKRIRSLDEEYKRLVRQKQLTKE